MEFTTKTRRRRGTADNVQGPLSGLRPTVLTRPPTTATCRSLLAWYPPSTVGSCFKGVDLASLEARFCSPTPRSPLISPSTARSPRPQCLCLLRRWTRVSPRSSPYATCSITWVLPVTLRSIVTRSQLLVAGAGEGRYSTQRDSASICFLGEPFIFGESDASLVMSVLLRLSWPCTPRLYSVSIARRILRGTSTALSLAKALIS